MQVSIVHSGNDLKTGQVMVWRASSWSSSSWFYIILVLQLKVNKSPRTGMTEGWHLHLLKLISRILMQTCCLFTSCILARVSIYRDNVKRMVGWFRFPRITLSPVKMEELSFLLSWISPSWV